MHLDIVHCGRAAIKPCSCRKRRFQARLAFLALQAFKHRGFFAADICARAAMDEDVKIIARFAGIFADQARCISLGNCGLQHLGFIDKFAANVDIGRARAHRKASDQRAFDQLVRIVADDLAVFAAAGFGFIGVDDKEIGAFGRRRLGHEAPLHPRRETSPAAPAQARCLDLVDNRIIANGEQSLGLIPIAAFLRSFQVPRLKAMDVGEDAVFVMRASCGIPRVVSGQHGHVA